MVEATGLVIAAVVVAAVALWPLLKSLAHAVRQWSYLRHLPGPPATHWLLGDWCSSSRERTPSRNRAQRRAQRHRLNAEPHASHTDDTTHASAAASSPLPPPNSPTSLLLPPPPGPLPPYPTPHFSPPLPAPSKTYRPSPRLDEHRHSHAPGSVDGPLRWCVQAALLLRVWRGGD